MVVSLRKNLYLVIFVSIFIGVLILANNVEGLTPAEIVYDGTVELNLQVEGELSTIAYDGSNLWGLMYNWSSDELILFKISLTTGIAESSNVISGTVLGYAHLSVYFNNYIWVITNYYDTNVSRYIHYIYRINPSTNTIVDYQMINVSGSFWINSMTVYQNKILLLISDQTTVKIVELDYETGGLIETNLESNFNTTELRSNMLGTFGDSLIQYTYGGEIYDEKSNLLRNITEDFPYNASFVEIWDLDTSPDGSKVTLLVYADYYEQNQQKYGYFIMKYHKKKTTEGVTTEATPTEPVTASSVAVATVAAATATAAVASMATTASTAATATAATTSAAGIGSSAVSMFPLSSKGEGLERFWKYGLRAGKALSKLIGRKKKDEEKFSKPSYVKALVLLAIVSSIVSLAIYVWVAGFLSDFFALTSIVMIGVGLGFGVFGALIGYLLLYAIRNNLLPPATTFGKIGLFASLIGGLYGILTSIFKFLLILGIVSIVGIVVIMLIGFVFAVSAYGMTLGLYNE